MSAQHDMENHPIVSRIGVMMVLFPRDEVLVDFDVSPVHDAVNSHDRIKKVRTAFAVPMANVLDDNASVVSRTKIFRAKVLLAPDVSEETLVVP